MRNEGFCFLTCNFDFYVWFLILFGICLEFSAWNLGFPPRGVSASCFASELCSCLIHQAQLPNKLGNYIFKLRLAMTRKERVTNVLCT